MIPDALDNHIEKLQNGSKRFRKEVRERVLTYLLAAFGLVAGLAWNEAIKALIEQIFPLDKDTLAVKFVYAVGVTVVVVLVTIYLIRFLKKEEPSQ